MSDIVERLRKLAAVDNCQASLEAADEIERLRGGMLKMASTMSTQVETIERLRAALRDIRDMGPMTVDDQRWRIARAALGGE